MRSSADIRAFAVGAALLAAGCLSRGPDPSPERNERFVGTWIVEQPYHALYEATVYQLRADGTVELGATYTANELAPDYVTGSVADPKSGVACRFAGSWYSVDEATLVVDGNCSDGRYREIVLGFADTPEQNTVDADVVVLSVGGEDGWLHDDWTWRWRRCDAGDDRCGLPL
jgi:hypothetical protein